MGKTQSRIGGSDRAIRSRIDRHQQPVENDAQPPGLGQLPETEKFQRLAPSRKQLVDTVKLIAYRAETALAAIVREELARTDDARSLLRDRLFSEADLLPDLEQRVLRVQVHPMSNPRADRESHTCWNISTRPSSPIPAPSCNSCTRSPAKPKPRTRFHNRIRQIRRSEPGIENGPES